MKQLIEDLISAIEYHVEQTRPIHSTTIALQAARDALKSLPPQRKPLTDEQWQVIADTLDCIITRSQKDIIDAKLKENT